MSQNYSIYWPFGAKAAVSLTYDDGLESQLSQAVPQLAKYGIKGTFFPSTWGLANPQNTKFWTDLVKAGHEIGCHTLNHPCSNSFEFTKRGYTLQEYTLDRINEEIDANIQLIKSFGYNNKELVFAYPCGQTAVGANLDISYKPIIANKFTAARGTKRGYAFPDKLQLNEIPCFGVEEDGEGLINIAKEAIRTNTWAVILLHGVGGDYISVTAQAHKELLEYLKDNNDIWTARFGAIAKYIIKQL